VTIFDFNYPVMGLAKNRTHVIGWYDIRHLLWWEACYNDSSSFTCHFSPRIGVHGIQIAYLFGSQCGLFLTLKSFATNINCVAKTSQTLIGWSAFCYNARMQ